MATVHIIGAGISGLCAASQLAAAHVPVKLYEASAQPGGRCRSSHDDALGSIDHGLHVFTGAARQLQQFIQRIGARDQFVRVPGSIALTDAKTHATSRVSPWRPLNAAPLVDHVQLLGQMLWPGDAPLSIALPEESPLHDAWLAPLCRLLLTREPHTASMRQLQRLLRRQLTRGGARLFMAKHSLQRSFVAPALAMLEYHGGSVYFGQSLKALEHGADGPSQLQFARKKLTLDAGDVVILATPLHVTSKWIAGLPTHTTEHAAITLHFQVAHCEPCPGIRVLSHAACDLLRYDDGAIRACIRVADHAWHSDPALLAARVWASMQRVHPYLAGQPMPAHAMWREKRAGHVVQDTPIALPALPPRLLLAGDWLDATRPATLEAAALYGHRAADAALALMGRNATPTQRDFHLN